MGRTELRTGPADLGALVLQVRDELRHALAAREVEWRIHPLPIVSGDTAMLRLVFQNLIDNALK
jgi:light-regulated signal transduction histidine kinase (bacteriophytochrome)